MGSHADGASRASLAKLAGIVSVLATLAVGMTGSGVNAQSISLSPDQLQQLQQMKNQQNGGVPPGQTLAPQQTILEPNALPNPVLPISRLEQLQSARAGTRLKQFGYDELGVARTVAVSQAGAVQDNYILGPGDEIVVTLRGQENAEYRAEVDRDGRVTLPRLGPISASGRSYGEFRRDLLDAVRRAYVATEGYVSVGRLRQISILVSGEVNSPGQRILSGLTTAVDAILVSGGVKKTGSLRNVYVLRGGKRITVDLYSVLTGHAEARPVVLTEGDRVVVPPLGATAAVVGWVRRPGIYEMASRSAMSVRELLSLAGGLEVRGKYRYSVLRVSRDGRNQMATVNGQAGSVGDSDILFVQPAASQTTSMATLSGGTPLAGQYAVTSTKLSQILNSPGALGENPYTLFGIISRRDPVTLLRTLVAFTPVAVLKGTEDIDIQSDDIVRVISTDEARVLFGTIERYRLQRQTMEEAIRNPQAVQPAATANTSALASGAAAALETASQLNAAGNTARQALAAANGQANQTGTPSGNGQNAGAPGQPERPPLQNGPQQPDQYGQPYSQQGPQQYQQPYTPPYQQTYTPPSQQPYQQPYQQAYPQQYPYAQPQQPDTTQPYAPNLQNDSGIPGQVPINLEVRRVGDLAGQLRVDPLVLINFLEDRSMNVDGAVQGPGVYLVGPDADVQSVLMAAGGLARWADKSAVEVISTNVDSNTGEARTDRRELSLAQGADAGYIVSPRDQIRVNAVFTSVGVGSITMMGQVRHAGTYQIVRGEHLSDVLLRAGGLTDSAYPYGTVFLRRSAAESEQDAFRREAQEIEDQLLTAMSRREANAKLSPDAFLALQSYVDQLKRQKGIGRVTVAADPAVLGANPTLDPLLEPGDVVYVPQRPYSVSVLGEVLQPGSVPYGSDMSASDYIDRAGGYAKFADESETILVLPDGSARRVNESWFRIQVGGDEIPPGSTIFVARDISGVDLHQIIVETTAIVSQLAVTAASLAVLSNQVK